MLYLNKKHIKSSVVSPLNMKKNMIKTSQQPMKYGSVVNFDFINFVVNKAYLYLYNCKNRPPKRFIQSDRSLTFDNVLIG